jgi:hypothetical protein
MAQLSVEVIGPEAGAPCAECGAPTTVTRGFVYADGDADALYFASWSPCAPSLVKLAVAVGDWSDDADESTRRAVLMDAVSEPDQLRFAITDPAPSPWKDLSVAQPLAREDALSDGAIDHVFEIVDTVAGADPNLVRLLEA